MEEKRALETPMELEDFKEYLKEHPLVTLAGVKEFKSLQRAIKRGHVTSSGYPLPKRPFNNRKPTRGRKENEYKKRLYEHYRRVFDKNIETREAE